MAGLDMGITHRPFLRFRPQRMVPYQHWQTDPLMQARPSTHINQ